jgi:hypothetical protein
VKRPLSIILIAIWLFLGAALELHSLLRGPIRWHFFNVLVFHLVHYAAIAAYVIDIQVRAFIGIGLLDRRPAARIVGIVFFAYEAVNAVLAFLQPSSLLAFMAATEADSRFRRFDADTMVLLRDAHALSLVVAVGVALLALYFLVTRRAAFYPPPAPTSSPEASAPSAEAASPAPQRNSAAPTADPPAGQGGVTR